MQVCFLVNRHGILTASCRQFPSKQPQLFLDAFVKRLC
jgi:hypothetical protein